MMKAEPKRETHNAKQLRGQASTEMLMVLSGVLIVFLLSISLAGGQIVNIAHAKNSMDAFMVARDLGSAMNAVFLGGDGAYADVYIGAENASASIDQRFLNVRVGSAYYDWPLLTNRTNNTEVPLGGIRVKNTYGVVSVEAL